MDKPREYFSPVSIKEIPLRSDKTKTPIKPAKKMLKLREVTV